MYSLFYFSINPLLSVYFCQSSCFTSQTSLRNQESTREDLLVVSDAVVKEKCRA